MPELWEIIQGQGGSYEDILKEAEIIRTQDVAASGSLGTKGSAREDHVHRGVQRLTISDDYLYGDIELVEGDNVDFSVSGQELTISVDFSGEVEVGSLIADSVNADVIETSKIKSQTASPGGRIIIEDPAYFNSEIRFDIARPMNDSPSNDMRFESDLWAYDLDIDGLAGNIITTESVETSIEELDDSQYVEYNTGFLQWTSGTDANTFTVDGTGFQIDRAGQGYIKGKLISWAASQKTTALAANTTSFIYIDDTGTIGFSITWSDELFRDYIVLFECLYDGTNYVTVRENHPVEFQTKVSTEWHELLGVRLKGEAAGPIGGNITRVATGTGGAAGDRQIKIVGEATLADHGLETTIPDSAGAAVTVNFYYTNASGYWIRYAQQTEFPMYYNNAGTPTALGSGKYTTYRIYVSKDNIESSAPTYYAVMDDGQYDNLFQARTAIDTGTPRATNELFNIELAQLGYAIVLNSGGGYIVELDIQKATLAGNITGAGASNLASLISCVTTNFDGVLDATDTNVQNSLETIDDMLTVAQTVSGQWVFTADAFFDELWANTVRVDTIMPSAESPAGEIDLVGDLSVDGDIAVTGTVDGVDVAGLKSDYDQHLIDYTHTDIALNTAARHDAVTLAASADVLLGLSTQQLSLDNQNANIVLAGPSAGAAAAPTFRSLVADDIPDLSALYASATGTIYVDHILPLTASPTGDIELDWDTTVSGDLWVSGNLSAGASIGTSTLWDYTDWVSGTTAGEHNWATTTGNSGTIGMNVVTAEPTHPGQVVMSTATNAAAYIILHRGAAAGSSPVSGACLAGGPVYVEYVIKLLDGASTAAQAFTVCGGLSASFVGIANQGVAIRHNDTLSSGNWEGIVVNAAGNTTADLGVAADSNWVRLGFIIAADGSYTDFYVNGIYRNTVTRQTSTLQVAPWIYLVKTNGTTARRVIVDSYYWKYDFTTAR